MGSEYYDFVVEHLSHTVERVLENVAMGSAEAHQVV
jgi:hypothetical protein